MISPQEPPRPSDAPSGDRGADREAFAVDLLRGELYRLADELARAPWTRHGELADAFERAWRAYREATARRSAASR